MSLSADEIRASLRAKRQPHKQISPESAQAARPAGPDVPLMDSGESSPKSAHNRSPRSTKTDVPHSAESEMGVLGSMMIAFGGEGKRAIARARDLLSPDAFYIPAHQILFRAMCEMDLQGQPVDPITLGGYLRGIGQEQTVGGPAYYTGLFVHVPSAANVEYYIQAVRDKYILRELVRTSTENVRQAMEPDADVASILQVAHQRLQLVESASSRFGRLPNLADISVLLNGARPTRPAELVNGLLHQGSKLIVGGTSKGRKTFSLIDLAVSVSTCAPWWGFETAPGPVCYINFEIQESFFCERTADICRVKKVELAKEMFMGWNLRGHSEGMENLTEEIVAKIISRHFSLVIFDPIYKGLGDRDENKAGDVASLMNELERVAVKTGAAIAFGAHYSKGNQALKESIDRIGGSGVFARDPDSILTMTAHEEPEAFTVDCTLRNFPPVEPFVLRWDWPLFIRTDLDPEALKQPRKKTGEYSVRYSKEMLLEQLSAVEGVRPAVLFKRLAELEGISRAQFYRLAKALKDVGRLAESRAMWFRVGPSPSL
jgi:AAA domain/DnaB-like helicase N terminal domain